MTFIKRRLWWLQADLELWTNKRNRPRASYSKGSSNSYLPDLDSMGLATYKLTRITNFWQRVQTITQLFRILRTFKRWIIRIKVTQAAQVILEIINRQAFLAKTTALRQGHNRRRVCQSISSSSSTNLKRYNTLLQIAGQESQVGLRYLTTIWTQVVQKEECQE